MDRLVIYGSTTRIQAANFFHLETKLQCTKYFYKKTVPTHVKTVSTWCLSATFCW